MRPQVFLISGVVLVVLVAGFLRLTATSTPAPTPNLAQDPASPRALDKPASKATGASSPPASAPFPKLPAIVARQDRMAGDPKLVQFEVVEGHLAVAFGDIILGQVPEGDDVPRNGHYEPPALRLWENPEIPYAIDATLVNPERVTQAIAYFNEHTPVRFYPRTTEPDALVFQTGEEHCYSSLGRTGGLQPVRLSPGCRPQEIIHELMHALGFVHEQSRPDRDQFVQVLWNNVDTKYRAQFEIVPELFMEAARGTAFDFKSVMLYRPDSFALKPGTPTMLPQSGRPAIEPTQTGLSESDIARLQRLFRAQ